MSYEANTVPLQQLLRSGPSDILATHEAPAAHPHGWQVIETLGVQLVVHGHHHQSIDYLAEGMQSAAAPFGAFGVDMGSHLAWPRDPQEETGSGAPPQDLLDLASQVFGAVALAWLDKPNEGLDVQTPSAFAARGGSEKVRSILNAIQHSGVV